MCRLVASSSVASGHDCCLPCTPLQRHIPLALLSLSLFGCTCHNFFYILTNQLIKIHNVASFENRYERLRVWNAICRKCTASKLTHSQIRTLTQRYKRDEFYKLHNTKNCVKWTSFEWRKRVKTDRIFRLRAEFIIKIEVIFENASNCIGIFFHEICRSRIYVRKLENGF